MARPPWHHEAATFLKTEGPSSLARVPGPLLRGIAHYFPHVRVWFPKGIVTHVFKDPGGFRSVLRNFNTSNRINLVHCSQGSYLRGVQVARVLEQGWVMSCPECASSNQSEFPTEMMIHLLGLKNVDNPGVWVFPKLLVCLDCGFARFTVQRPELALLAAGTQDGVHSGEQVSSGHRFDNVAKRARA